MESYRLCLLLYASCVLVRASDYNVTDIPLNEPRLLTDGILVTDGDETRNHADWNTRTMTETWPFTSNPSQFELLPWTTKYGAFASPTLRIRCSPRARLRNGPAGESWTLSVSWVAHFSEQQQDIDVEEGRRQIELLWQTSGSFCK